MKLIFFLSFSFMLTAVQAQSDSLEQVQINKDVWYNFMQAYDQLDASLFNQIHTDDVLRVAADNGTMYIGQEYKDKNLEVFNRWNSQRIDQKIEFSFLSRSQKGNWAHEIGIYKLTRKRGGQSKSYYGKFNVTLQKIDSIWKIRIDSDTSENGTIDITDFEKGQILDY